MADELLIGQLIRDVPSVGCIVLKYTHVDTVNDVNPGNVAFIFEYGTDT